MAATLAPSISVIDIANQREVGRTPVADAWYGLVFSPNGKSVFAGGGSKARVYELSFNAETGQLSSSREFLAINDSANPGHSFIGDVAPSPDGHLLYAADLLENQIAVINLQSGRLIDRWKAARRPYRILIPPGGRVLIVTSWADAAVYRYDATSGNPISVTRTAPHPTDLLWLNRPAPAESGEAQYAARLFVAAANTNNVYSLELHPKEISGRSRQSTPP